MAEKRLKRTKEELAAEVDKKIEAHREAIAKLEQRKKDLLTPKPRISKQAAMKVILDKAKKAGMSPAEIAEKLGLSE